MCLVFLCFTQSFPPNSTNSSNRIFDRFFLGMHLHFFLCLGFTQCSSIHPSIISCFGVGPPPDLPLRREAHWGAALDKRRPSVFQGLRSALEEDEPSPQSQRRPSPFPLEPPPAQATFMPLRPGPGRLPTEVPAGDTRELGVLLPFFLTCVAPPPHRLHGSICGLTTG